MDVVPESDSQMVFRVKLFVIYLPVIRGDVSTIFHRRPVGPGSLFIAVGFPDVLAPDDILEIEGITILHGPFGDLIAAQCWCLQVLEMCFTEDHMS